MTGKLRPVLRRRRAARAVAAAAAETARILGYFETGHLPEHLAGASRPCGDLAWEMAAMLGHGPETRIGLRLLLLAKDCFVRAAVDKHQATQDHR
jgi:hypothetical protein